MEFSDEVKKLLESYEQEVAAAMKELVPEVAKEGLKKLKKESPRSKGKHGGTYAKGWAVSINEGRLKTDATIYGKAGTYQLAHLLENGHAKRGGGYVSGAPHIAPVEEWMSKELEERIMKRLEQ